MSTRIEINVTVSRTRLGTSVCLTFISYSCYLLQLHVFAFVFANKLKLCIVKHTFKTPPSFAKAQFVLIEKGQDSVLPIQHHVFSYFNFQNQDVLVQSHISMNQKLVFF